MCIFTGPAEVSGTKIYARVAGDHQFLAYEMTFAAETHLAMVLPPPAPPKSPQAVAGFTILGPFHRFVDAFAHSLATHGVLVGGV